MRTETRVLGSVLDALGDRAREATVSRVTLGDRALGVELEGPDGPTMGVAYRPAGRPGNTPRDASALARWAVEADGSVDRAVGIATLNALSTPHVDWRCGDPMAALSTDVERIATVGLFRPAFRKFEDVEVRVIERWPIDGIEPPPGVVVETFEPDRAPEAIAGVDALFVTGSALVYGGIDRYLHLAAAVPTVVLIGATASFLPGPAFAAGVSVLAGARVIDPDAVREAISAGACGTDLHDAGLEKVYVASATEGLALEPTADERLRAENS